MFCTQVFQMGYGESILLSNQNECLLVDCGSESRHKEQYFKNVKLEVLKYSKRQAMISHFHDDHINGFMKIISDQPHIFEKVYIPHIFTMNHPNLTDMELIKYFLERKYFPGSHTITLWDFLKFLCKNHQSIKLLQREKSAFEWGEDEFDVLWPIPENLVHTKLLSSVRECIDAEFLETIYELSDRINESFIMLDGTNGDYPQDSVIPIIASIERTAESYAEMQFFDSKKKQHMRLLQSITKNANKASIVFQNRICYNLENNACFDSVLMTGDVPNTTMKKIAEGVLSPEVPMNKRYSVIKALHHGTDTHYFNFGAYVLFDKLIISNGDTGMSNRGRISRNYNLLRRNYRIICTNNLLNRCESCCVNPITACSKTYDTCGCSSAEKFISV